MDDVDEGDGEDVPVEDDDFIVDDDEEDEEIVSNVDAWDGDPIKYNKFFTSTGERRQRRPNTSAEQTNLLEKVYQQNQKPSANERDRLAAQLDWTPRSVQIW